MERAATATVGGAGPPNNQLTYLRIRLITSSLLGAPGGVDLLLLYSYYYLLLLSYSYSYSYSYYYLYYYNNY